MHMNRRWINGGLLALALAALFLALPAMVSAEPPSGLPGKWKVVEGSKGVHLGLIYRLQADGKGQTDLPGRRVSHWSWVQEGDQFMVINPNGRRREHKFQWLGKHRFKLSGPYGHMILQRQ